MNAYTRLVSTALIAIALAHCGTDGMQPGEDAGSSDAAASFDGGAGDASTALEGDASVGTMNDAGNDGRPKIGDTDGAGRTLTWADEFDGPGIDQTVWGNETGFVRNSELQNYTTDAKNQFIDNGQLVIKGIYEGGSGQGAYTSASLTTRDKKTFQYGRIEARIKTPAPKGSWPAFWMLPPGKSWPSGGEIDVVEVVSQMPNVVNGNAHYASGGNHAYMGGYTTLASPAPSDFHVYAVEWTATQIDWYVDATKYATFNTTTGIDGAPFQAPFYMILNYAIGGSWPEAPDSSQYPGEMRVDWVRVWQ